MDLPMRSPNVIFSQNPRIGPCRAIPLEQLTNGICDRKCSKGMELRLGHPMLNSKGKLRGDTPFNRVRIMWTAGWVELVISG